MTDTSCISPTMGKKNTEQPDEASRKGHFGWDMQGKCYIPYIYRSSEKYVAVRMAEMKLLKKYLNYLHADIYSSPYTCIRSYYITEIEAHLLNEINNVHCDGQFGRKPFSQKDMIMLLADVYKIYKFLDVCYNKLLRGTTNSKDKCGFIRINKDSIVPYIIRDNQKFVPLFYFEGETDKFKLNELKGWDLLYLKFCCKVQGIRDEIYAYETCLVFSLSDMKSSYPPETEFEEFWPKKVAGSQLLISAKGAVSGRGQWTLAPPAPPPGVVGGVGDGSNSVTLNVPNQPTRGRQATTQRHSSTTLPRVLTRAQTQQIRMLAREIVSRVYEGARNNNAAIAAAAAALSQQLSDEQLATITMAMGQQPPLVKSSANKSTTK